LWISFLLRTAYAISFSHVFQSERPSRRRKGSNLVKASYWVSLKKDLVTQRVKDHRPELQREKGHLLNTAGADPSVGVFPQGIVVERCLRVPLQIEMLVKADAISLVHRTVLSHWEIRLDADVNLNFALIATITCVLSTRRQPQQRE
jgi:hypothetical protein